MVNKRERLERAGAWLRSMRQRRGFHSAGDFAAALGVDASMVSRYERGDSEVSDERAEQIAHTLGMDIIEVRRGLHMWAPEEDWLERLADQTLGYELDALRANLAELLEHLDDLIGRHVGDPRKAAERHEYRRQLALGDTDVVDPDQHDRDVASVVSDIHAHVQPKSIEWENKRQHIIAELKTRPSDVVTEAIRASELTEDQKHEILVLVTTHPDEDHKRLRQGIADQAEAMRAELDEVGSDDAEQAR